MDIWQQIILKMEILNKQLDAKEITLKEYACRTNGLKLQFGAAMGALKAEDMCLGNTDYARRLKKRSLIGNGALITHSPEQAALEVIECEQLKAQLTREECKSNSGSGRCDASLCPKNSETRALTVNRLEGRMFGAN